MRGVDYRCTDGIDLFIDATSSNERAYLQALGRVGRCDDPYSRYIRGDLETRYRTVERVLPQTTTQTTLTFQTAQTAEGD